MVLISAARKLQQPDAQDYPMRLARVLPFKARKPEPEIPSVEKMANPAQISFLKAETSRSSPKDKGAARRSAEPPSDHWLIAWVIWSYYVAIYTQAGLRTDKGQKRYDFYQRPVTRT